MADWFKSLLELYPEKAQWPIVKRTKDSVHLLRPNGKIEAIIDPDYAGDMADGCVFGYSTSFDTSRDTAYSFNNADTVIDCGQILVGGYYYTWRGFLKFDTSSIPDDASIIQVNLKMVYAYIYVISDFDTKIVKQDWSAQDPLSSGNMETAYDNCLGGTLDSSSFGFSSGRSINTQYSSGNLSTQWVRDQTDAHDATYYSLISSRDISNTPPATVERVRFYSQDSSIYRPILTVVYTEFIPRIIII